jgi:hypothetical protein
MTRRIRDVLVFAFAFAALAVALAIWGVEASARPVVAAIPVSWLFCDQRSEIASDAGGTRGEGEPSENACAFLSWMVTAPWQGADGGEDDDAE